MPEKFVALVVEESAPGEFTRRIKERSINDKYLKRADNLYSEIFKSLFNIFYSLLFSIERG